MYCFSASSLVCPESPELLRSLRESLLDFGRGIRGVGGGDRMMGRDLVLVAPISIGSNESEGITGDDFRRPPSYGGVGGPASMGLLGAETAVIVGWVIYTLLSFSFLRNFFFPLVCKGSAERIQLQ